MQHESFRRFRFVSLFGLFFMLIKGSSNTHTHSHWQTVCVLVLKKKYLKKNKQENGRTKCTQKRQANPEICSWQETARRLRLSRKVGNARARIVGAAEKLATENVKYLKT